jgi:hypothetical protein
MLNIGGALMYRDFVAREQAMIEIFWKSGEAAGSFDLLPYQWFEKDRDLLHHSRMGWN